MLSNHGNPVLDLGTLEPYCWSVEGLPIKEIVYEANSIKLVWFTQEEYDSIREHLQEHNDVSERRSWDDFAR